MPLLRIESRKRLATGNTRELPRQVLHEMPYELLNALGGGRAARACPSDALHRFGLRTFRGFRVGALRGLGLPGLRKQGLKMRFKMLSSLGCFLCKQGNLTFVNLAYVAIVRRHGAASVANLFGSAPMPLRSHRSGSRSNL